MKVGIIAVGNEVVSGQTINTNASFISNELENLGFDPLIHIAVKDNMSEIHLALKEVLSMADLVITTGGLGPTPDDLTHEAIYAFFKTKPKQDKKTLKQIKNKFRLRGYKKMPPMNIKQSYKPKDAKWISNKTGTANGIIWQIKKKIIITFPGVPAELKQMWEDTANPFLKKMKNKFYIYTKTLKFTGIGESALAEKIKPLLTLKNPIIATYAELGQIKVRITAKEKSIQKAKKTALAFSTKVLRKTKRYYFGQDNEILESLLAIKLIQSKKTLAIAESCTGGLFSKRLTDISGSSRFFKLSAVTYSNDTKNKLLNIPEKILTKYGAVSSQTASAMAKGIQELAKSNIGLSITGIAGPTGGSKIKPVGLVYFGLAKRKSIKIKKVLFGKDRSRNEIRTLAAQYALNWLLNEI